MSSIRSFSVALVAMIAALPGMATAATQVARVEYRFDAFCYTCAPERDFTASLVLQNYAFNTPIKLSNIVSFSADGNKLLDKSIIQQYLVDEQTVSDRQTAVDMAKTNAAKAQGLADVKKALLQGAEANRDAAKSVLDSIGKQIAQYENDLGINQQQITEKMAGITIAQAAGASAASIAGLQIELQGLLLEQGNLNQNIAAAKSALPNVLKQYGDAQAAVAVAAGALAEARGQVNLALDQLDQAKYQLQTAQLALVPTGIGGVFTADEKQVVDFRFYRGLDDFFTFDARGFKSDIGGQVQYGNNGYWSRVIPQQGGDVPEPAIWAMMLFGFGAVGASLRLRRTTATSA